MARTQTQFAAPADDERQACVCGMEIRWSLVAKKWFHVHNYMTFCTGMAIDENHVDQPRGRPSV
jgi:hypothetical protein